LKALAYLLPASKASKFFTNSRKLGTVGLLKKFFEERLACVFALPIAVPLVVGRVFQRPHSHRFQTPFIDHIIPSPGKQVRRRRISRIDSTILAQIISK